MRRAALIVLITAIYVGCARAPAPPRVTTRPPPATPQPTAEIPPPLPQPQPQPEPTREPEPEQPQPGGTLRLALSLNEREALAYYALEAREGAEAAFASDRNDRWNRLASTTLLDHVEFVSDRRIEAVELFLLGEIDLTPVYGRNAARMQAADPAQVRLFRATGWDRTYLLVCDAQARWTSDPNFRRWLAETIDRVDLVNSLFEGRGAPAWTVQARAAGPIWNPPTHHPFSSTSSPVLRLKYDPADATAGSIASRMKALFEADGIDLRLNPEEEDEPAELTLVSQQRWSPDPVVGLAPLVTATGEAGQGAARYLDQARAAVGETRERLVTLAEDALLMEALVVPLVRQEAWLAVAPALEGVQPGLAGDLGLEKAWWKP